jgi:iron complex outermembrane recepter protein
MRIAVMVAAVCVSLVGLSNAQNANAAMKRPTHIPAQSLGSALKTLAQERDLQVLYFSDTVKDLHTGGASGDLTQDEALTQLLKGTGLEYRYVDAKAVTILAAGSHEPAAPTTTATATAGNSHEEGKTSSSPQFRLAQVDQGQGPRAASLTAAHDPNEQLEEIVVTAQKREERLLDVPLSIVAITGQEIERRETVSLDDLSMAVPGMTVQSQGGNTRRIVLRGVSNTFGSSSLIGLYLDEAAVTTFPAVQPDLRTYDLERVEVLRGPQGTLYGEGSAGGTIRFVTKDPVLDAFSMKADVAALFTEDGAPGQRIEAVVNAPVVDNVFGLRVAGTFDHEGGWIDQPAADRKDFNDQDLVDVRAKALWKPTSQLAVNGMALIHRNDPAPNNTGEDANGNYTQVFNLTTTPTVRDDYDLYNATISYDFPAFRLLSATSYIKQDKHIKAFGYQIPLDPSLVFDLYAPVTDYNTEVTTQELRATSTASERLEWTVGGFYRHARFDIDIPTNYFGVNGPVGTPLPPPYAYQDSLTSESWAVFGDAKLHLTHALAFGAGVRYYRDDQRDVSAGVEQTGRFSATSPRAYAQYQWTENVNTYVSAAKGFRSGGFNAQGEPSYSPESVWTYELGTKSRLAGNRLSADIALFYSDYSQYQIVGLTSGNPIPLTSNAGDAWIKGVEWAFAAHPATNWTFALNGDYITSRFYKINATSTAYDVGDPLDLFPKYSVAASGQYDFRVSDKHGFARLDYNRRGRMTYRNRNLFGPTPTFYSESDVIDLLNLNVGLDWNDNLSFGVFGQNLLNDRGYTDPYSIQKLASRSRPRTYGLQCGVRF